MERTFFCFLLQQQQERLSATALNASNITVAFFQGISAIFSAVDSINGHRIDALFRADDIPNYEAFAHSDCPMCKEGKPVEALVNGYGYSEI